MDADGQDRKDLLLAQSEDLRPDLLELAATALAVDGDEASLAAWRPVARSCVLFLLD